VPKTAIASPKRLSAWVDSLQARGQYTFARDAARAALGISPAAFGLAARRLCAKRRITRLRGGFYAINPLEYYQTGILPADWFIDDLMKHMGRPYYVGLLTAAALYGAAHQQPQEFEVVTGSPLRAVVAGPLKIRFFAKRSIGGMMVERRKTATGTMAVSTPEATALDLLVYTGEIGGLDRTYTVIQELGESLRASRLAIAARSGFKTVYVQRLGWMLDKAGFAPLANVLADWVEKAAPAYARLDPSSPENRGARDGKWRLFINASVEGDL
jgi:predicted transcriptional regulator of viral defense system